MDKIELNKIVPHVFSVKENLDSEVWNNEIGLEKGKSYLIEAASGTGKSSLCSFIYGYRKDYEGKISFDDADIKSFTNAGWTEIRQKHIGIMFQELRLFPELTAGENVIIKNNLTGFRSMEQIKSWFSMLGIEGKWNEPVGKMSFGQQQRVAMMRALVQPFDFILADEPISHLDDSNSNVMGKLMMTEAKAQGAGVIVTSIGKHMDLDYEKVFKL